MERNKSSLFRRLIAAALCAGILTSLAACSKVPAETTAPPEPVTAQKAIAQLQDMSNDLGFDNALDELEEKNTTQIGGDTYIRLQQYYEGLPVYGKTIVYAADAQGEVRSVTGNVQDVGPGMDMTPTVTADAVLATVNQFFNDTFGDDADCTVTSVALTDDALCIYAGQSEGTSRLAYCIVENGYELVVDAHDGTLLQSNCLFRWSTQMNLTGQQTVYNNVEIQEDSGSYRLTDTDRKITSYYAIHTEMSELWGLFKYQVHLNGDSYEIVWSNGDAPPADAVDAYVNTQITYDYFDQVLDNTSPDGEGRGQILLLSGIQYVLDENGNISSRRLNNASSTTNPVTGATLLCFGIGTNGKPAGSAHIDWVAHEYMHSVEAYHSGMIYNGQSGAIMEGLSDIFGELVESWHTSQNPNWIFTGTTRNMLDPSQGGYPETANDKNKSNEDYVHGYSTVISHSAYLMWNGINGNSSKKLSELQLAELWYRAMLMMPSDCDFILCRQLVEVAAQSMEDLTDAQRTCVSEAFDKVAIPSTRVNDPRVDYHLAPDCTLTVYDQNNTHYAGYTIRADGIIDPKYLVGPGLSNIEYNVSRTFTVDEAGPFVLDLPQGIYTLTISDRHSEITYTILIQISDKYTAANLDLITAYEDPLVVVIPDIDYDNLVSDAYSDVVMDGDGYEYCYHIPQFNLPGDLAQPLNEKIYRHCDSLLAEDVYLALEQYCYPDMGGMYYSWGYHGEYASVVIMTNPCWVEYPMFIVYSVSTTTGQEASTDSLLKGFGLDREQYDTLVRNRLKDYWDERREDHPGMSDDAFFNRCVEQTLSEENIQRTMPYINANGGLSFIALIYSLAGADYYFTPINAEGPFLGDYPACTQDHAPTILDDPLQNFIENCDRIYFTEADIQSFDDEMCMYARNAVFAKSGRIFQSEKLQAYFEQYSWYDPRIEPADFRQDMLNVVQLANIDLILAREEQLEIDAMLETLEGEEGIYTRYLHSGGYEELLGQDYDRSSLQVSSCLTDLDNDGTRELFLSLKTGSSGIRGMETYTYLLDIEDGQVVLAADAYFSGGSMGGDTLGIRYDSQTQTHVLVLSGYIRDGVEAYESYLFVYSKPDFEIGLRLSKVYYRLYFDWYKDAADEIRSKTNLYYEDGEDFLFYQIDRQYVPVEVFDSTLARFEDPREGFQAKEGSYKKPVA